MSLKSLTRSTVAIVSICLVAGTVPAQAQPLHAPTALAAPIVKMPKVHKSSTVIVRPKAQAKIRKHDLRIKIRAKHGIVRAKLNKVDLSRSDFVWKRGPFYVLDASSSHGLKHKRNRLTIVVRNGKGGLKKQRTTFMVKHKKPLTGAGRDVTVMAGSSITLPGRVRAYPGTKRGSKSLSALPSLTWTVVRAPGQDPVVDPDTGRRLTLDTDRPGTYVLKAAGSSGGAKTNDTVTLDAVAAPMLEVDTTASAADGSPGIKLGQTVYPAHGALDKAQWQMIVLDRHTGAVAPGFNFTYGVCPDSASALCRWNKDGRSNRSPQQDVAAMDSTQMAIVVHHQRFGGDMNGAGSYFAGLGIPKGFSPNGPTSLIGLSGWDAGQAWRAVNSSRGLKGSLQWDTNKNLTFVSGDRTGFDTRAGGGCGPDTCTVTMMVGGEPKTYSIPKSNGGFAVQAYDRSTMAFINGRVFDLNGAPPAISEQVVAMISFIRQLPKNAMVMVSSIGSPQTQRMGVPGLPSQYTRSCWFSGLWCTDSLDIQGRRVVADLTDTIADLGGTRHAFLQSVRTPGDNYALVGWAGLGETNGSQVHSETGRLSGAFVRGNDNKFVTANVTEDDAAQELLTSLVGGTPKPNAWPGTGNPVYQAALDDIGKRIGIGADPRSAFWTRNEALDNGNPTYWSDRADKVRALTPAQGIDPGVWKQAQTELAQELVWVSAVRQYFVWLKHPYQVGNQLSAWISATNIATTLRTSDDYAKNQKVEIDWLEVFATLIDAVAPFAGFIGKAAEKVIHIVAGLTAAALEYAAMGLANAENGEQITQKDEQEVKALEVQTQVVDRMQKTADSFDRMADIIVSDYPKLQKLGTLTACNIENRTCETGFETMTNDTFDRMSVSAKRTAEQTVFKELLPIAWPVNTIPTEGRLSGDGYPEGNWDAKRYKCYSASLFNDLPDRANLFTMNQPKYRLSDNGNFNPLTTPQFQVYVIGEINSRNNVITPSDTAKGDKSILGRMFKPMSSSFDVTDGGLGIDPAEFMAEVQAQKLTKDYDLTCGGWDYSDNKTPAPVN